MDVDSSNFHISVMAFQDQVKALRKLKPKEATSLYQLSDVMISDEEAVQYHQLEVRESYSEAALEEFEQTKQLHDQTCKFLVKLKATFAETLGYMLDFPQN